MSTELSTRAAETADFVVGVGASAGGLEALECLFAHTAADLECAFVVVTHLSPDFKSLLDELLGRYTKMMVKVAEDGDPLLTGVVYVIPASKEMITAQGRLLLKDRDRTAHHTLPIDVFLKSLAREYGPKAIAVILSGSGSDGSRALEEMRDHDGYVIVQTPDEAKFNGMPSAAIDTGGADRVLPAREIGAAIRDRIAGRESELAEEFDSANDSRSDELERVLKLVESAASVDFAAYKTKTIYRRIRRRMLARKHTTMRGYIAELEANPEEALALADELLITVTEFFRDRNAFGVLRESVISQLVARIEESRTLRIWVPACATGEEAYSLAILLYLEGRKQGKRIEPQIFATDVQTSAIDVAGRGIYTAEQLVGAPQEAIDLCFEKLGDDQFQIIAPIRRWIVFAQHNILADPPFTRMDMISCRNVLIYLHHDAQQKALSLFNFGLKNGGVLFLGPSENLGSHGSDFETISQRWRVFRKIGGTVTRQLATEANRALIETVHPKTRLGRAQSVVSHVPRLPTAYLALLEHLAPSGVLINRQRDVLHVFGDAGTHLHAPSGAMHPDILRMVNTTLRSALAAGIERAASDGVDMIFPRVETDSDGPYALQVTPLPSPVSAEAGHFLIRINRAGDEPSTDGGTSANAVIVDAETIESEQVERLERELDQTRENLQATIEEVETSNEEMQSTNEELMAANEELQSTNEELQSVNEELYTVNAEYQKKNDELVDLTRDIENLMAATEIGVLFVDERLIVKRFTSAATEILNLMSQDVGRSLEHITHKLLNLDLPSLVRQTLRSRRAGSADCLSQRGDWWQVRVIPLKAEKGHSDGVVITLYDVTSVKAREIELKRRADELETIAALAGVRAMHFDKEGNLSVEQSWSEITGMEAEKTRGLGWLEAIHPDDRKRVKRDWAASVKTGAPKLTEYFRIIRNNDPAQVRHVKLISHRGSDEEGEAIGWIGVIVDIEDAVQSERVVRGSERVLQAILRASVAPVSYVGADWRFRYANEAYLRTFGAARDEVIGKHVREVLPKSLYDAARPQIEAALSGKRVSFRRRATSDTGLDQLFEVTYEPDIATSGETVGFAAHLRKLVKLAAQDPVNMNHATFIGRALLHSDLAFINATPNTLEIIYASSEAARVSGYSEVELRRMTLPDLLPEYDRERLAEISAEAAASDSPIQEMDTFLLTRDGATLDIQLKLFSGEESGGDCVVAMISDRTSAREAEAALRRRTAELSRSNRMLETFAAAATHEMKEPLRKIDKFSEILFEDYGGSLDDEGRATLATLVQASARMRRIIESVLELARIERSTPKIGSIELDEILEQALSGLSKQIGESDAEIEIAPLPIVRGDGWQLEMLFRNLIGNALMHRHPDRKPKIALTCEASTDPKRAVIHVADNGPGIPREEIGNLFLPFSQLGTNRCGTGMGLALCDRIVRAHGGEMRVAETSDSGTVFEVTLPL